MAPVISVTSESLMTSTCLFVWNQLSWPTFDQPFSGIPLRAHWRASGLGDQISNAAWSFGSTAVSEIVFVLLLIKTFEHLCVFSARGSQPSQQLSLNIVASQYTKRLFQVPRLDSTKIGCSLYSFDFVWLPCHSRPFVRGIQGLCNAVRAPRISEWQVIWFAASSYCTQQQGDLPVTIVGFADLYKQYQTSSAVTIGRLCCAEFPGEGVSTSSLSGERWGWRKSHPLAKSCSMLCQGLRLRASVRNHAKFVKCPRTYSGTWVVTGNYRKSMTEYMLGPWVWHKVAVPDRYEECFASCSGYQCSSCPFVICWTLGPRKSPRSWDFLWRQLPVSELPLRKAYKRLTAGFQSSVMTSNQEVWGFCRSQTKQIELSVQRPLVSRGPESDVWRCLGVTLVIWWATN